MDTIAILLLGTLWVVISVVVVVKGTKSFLPAHASWHACIGVGALLALIMLLIPATDDLWGRYRVKRFCESEGGTRIFRTVENVEGLQMPSSAHLWVGSGRYRFVETAKSSVFGDEYIEGPARYSLGPTGRVIVEKKIVPKARYAYRTQEMDLGGYIKRREQLIVDLQSQEILAKETRFGFPGGWVIRWITAGQANVLGAGCMFPVARHPDFILTVLKPVK